MCLSFLISDSAAQTHHHHATATGGNAVIKDPQSGLWTSCARSGHMLLISSESEKIRERQWENENASGFEIRTGVKHVVTLTVNIKDTLMVMEVLY